MRNYQFPHTTTTAQEIDLYTKVTQMRALPAAAWGVRDMKAVLAAAGQPLAGGAEISEARELCQAYFASLPLRVPLLDLCAYLPPQRAVAAEVTSATRTAGAAAKGACGDEAAAAGLSAQSATDGKGDQAAGASRDGAV